MDTINTLFAVIFSAFISIFFSVFLSKRFVTKTLENDAFISTYEKTENKIFLEDYNNLEQIIEKLKLKTGMDYRNYLLLFFKGDISPRYKNININDILTEYKNQSEKFTEYKTAGISVKLLKFYGVTQWINNCNKDTFSEFIDFFYFLNYDDYEDAMNKVGKKISMLNF